MTKMKLAQKVDEKQIIYLGIDVHKKQWSVCFVTDGEVLGIFTIPGKFAALEKLMQRYEGSEFRSVYEAGFSGFHLHYKLEAIGVKNIVVSPQKIPVEVGNLVKTDKRDAKKLAYSLSKGLLRGDKHGK